MASRRLSSNQIIAERSRASIASADSLLRLSFSFDQPHTHNSAIRYYVCRFPPFRRLVLSLADELRLNGLGASDLYGHSGKIGGAVVSMERTGGEG